MANSTYKLDFSGSSVNELLTTVSAAVASGSLLTTASTINASQIPDAVIGTSKITDGAVTSAKLASDAVTNIAESNSSANNNYALLLSGRGMSSGNGQTTIIKSVTSGKQLYYNPSTGELAVPTIKATHNILVASKTIATQEWVSAAINSAVLSAINSQY